MMVLMLMMMMRVVGLVMLMVLVVRVMLVSAVGRHLVARKKVAHVLAVVARVRGPLRRGRPLHGRLPRRKGRAGRPGPWPLPLPSVQSNVRGRVSSAKCGRRMHR